MKNSGKTPNKEQEREELLVMTIDLGGKEE